MPLLLSLCSVCRCVEGDRMIGKRGLRIIERLYFIGTGLTNTTATKQAHTLTIMSVIETAHKDLL